MAAVFESILSFIQPHFASAFFWSLRWSSTLPNVVTVHNVNCAMPRGWSWVALVGMIMIVDKCVKDPKSAIEDNPGKRKGKVLENHPAMVQRPSGNSFCILGPKK